MSDTPLVAEVVSPLVLISDTAARLATSEPLVERIHDVIARIRMGLGAEECVLWLHGPGGLVAASRSGEAQVTEEYVGTAIESEAVDDGVIALRKLVAGSRRLGALSVRYGEPPGAESFLAVSALARIIATVLSHAEHLRHLESQVATRAKQIEDERRFTNRIIDSLPLGLYVIDREYRIQAWNRSRETGIQGVSRDDAIGRTIFEILHRQPAEVLRREFDEVFRSGRIQQFNIETKNSGTPRTFRITKIPMRMHDGGISHVISIGEDVTEWATAQERFAQSDKLAALGQLAAGVMHEVNNPLATIAVCAESLGQRLEDLQQQGVTVPEQAGAYLRTIDNEVHRCKGIVDRLLDFSRPKRLSMTPCNLNAVIEEALFLVRHHHRFKTISVQSLPDADLGDVMGNAEQLVQAFMTLLINAADAMNETGQVTIRTRRGESPSEGVVAEVIDSGSGIAREDLPRIFEPFYTTKASGRGTGLGLSICYGIVAEHSGRIEVDSAVGVGSTFRILLPEHPAAL